MFKGQFFLAPLSKFFSMPKMREISSTLFKIFSKFAQLIGFSEIIPDDRH